MVNGAGVRLSEHRVQCIGGVGIHARDEVAVDVQGHADIAMPQPFLRDLRRHALYEQHRGMSVAKCVKADVAQVRPLQQHAELAEHVAMLQRFAEVGAEHQVVIVPV